MKTFRVRAEALISLSTVVEAETEAEAIKIAMERGVESIHVQGDDEREWTTSGEIDGEPRNLTVDQD